MQRYLPSLWDRLVDGPSGHDVGASRLYSIDQVKDSVARDLEALLNTRRGLTEAVLATHKRARRSVVSYGMDDFVSLTLLSETDRNFISNSIRRAIADHEPRLRQVEVRLEADGSNLQRLRFAIRALLVLNPTQEPVSFDAMLQTLTQQYSVQRESRARTYA